MLPNAIWLRDWWRRQPRVKCSYNARIISKSLQIALKTIYWFFSKDQCFDAVLHRFLYG